MIDIVNFYKDLLVEPFTPRTGRSFSEVFHRTATKRKANYKDDYPKRSIYTSLTTSSFEDRTYEMFYRSLLLLEEHIEIETFREDVNELLIDALCDYFEEKFNIIQQGKDVYGLINPPLINRKLILEDFKSRPICLSRKK